MRPSLSLTPDATYFVTWSVPPVSGPQRDRKSVGVGRGRPEGHVCRVEEGMETVGGGRSLRRKSGGGGGSNREELGGWVGGAGRRSAGGRSGSQREPEPTGGPVGVGAVPSEGGPSPAMAAREGGARRGRGRGREGARARTVRLAKWRPPAAQRASG